MGELDLAEYVASRTAERMREEYTKDLELFGKMLKEQWSSDLAKLRDDLTASGLLSSANEASSLSRSKDSNEESSGRGICVLIVDDTPEVRHAIRRAFEYAGMTVLEAEDGVSGAETLSNSPSIEVAILDISMPKNGYTLLEHTRKNHPTVEVIMTSGFDVTIDDLLRLGAFGFLPKPFSLAQAVLLVRRAAEARRSKTTTAGSQG